MMLINMLGKLERRFTYSGDKNEPTMVINNHSSRSSVFIPLPCAYKYDDPKTEQEKQMAAVGLIRIAEALQTPVDHTSLLKLLEFIQDGLDELVKMKPFERKKQAVAEFKASINGESQSGLVME